MPRGTPLPPSRSSARLSQDMLRETCPEDLEEIDAPVRPRPPSPWIIFAPPLGICVAVVLVAALHSALGSPLGVEWASEVWGLAKMAILPTVASTALGVYVVRNNERAWDRPPQRPLTGPHQTIRQVRSGSYRVLPPPAEWDRFRDDEEDGP